MFQLFESSYLLSFPLSMLMGVMVFLLMRGVLNSVPLGVGVNALGSHLTKSMYPGILIFLNLFLIMLVVNVLSLVPGSFPMMSVLAFTLGFSVLVWMGGYIYCLVHNFKHCMAHFLPLSAPMVLSIVLVWIELISLLCRPMALGVRLMANITASHLIMSMVGAGVFVSSALQSVLVSGLFLLVVLEVGVAVIQSYVYNLLLSLYMSESLE